MKKPFLVLAAALLVLVAALQLWDWTAPASDPVERVTPVAAGGSAMAEGGESDPDAARQPARRPAGDANERESPPVAPKGRCQLLDHAGMPRAGVPFVIHTVVPLSHQACWPGDALPTFPEDAPETGADGSFALPRSSAGKGLLWFRISDAHFEGFELAGLGETAVLRLAESEPLRVACFGLGDTDKWKLWVEPAMRDDEDGSWIFGRILYPLPGAGRERSRPAYVILGVREYGFRGTAEHSVSAVVGPHYNLVAQAERYEVPGEDFVVTAPARKHFVVGARQLARELRLLDRETGLVHPLDGTVTLSGSDAYIHDYALENGRCMVGFADIEDSEQLRVSLITAEGEVFVRDLTARSWQETVPIDFVRGEGRAPLEVQIPARFTAGNPPALWLRDEDGALRSSTQAPHGFHAKEAAPKTFAYSILQAGRLHLYVDDSNWRSLGLADETGRVWICEPEKDPYGSARTPLIAKPLPADTLRPVDLESLWHAYLPHDGIGMTLQLALPGLEGEARWFRVGHRQLREADAKGSWQLHAPRGWHARLQIWANYRSHTIDLPR